MIIRFPEIKLLPFFMSPTKLQMNKIDVFTMFVCINNKTIFMCFEVSINKCITLLIKIHKKIKLFHDLFSACIA